MKKKVIRCYLGAYTELIDYILKTNKREPVANFEQSNYHDFINSDT